MKQHHNTLIIQYQILWPDKNKIRIVQLIQYQKPKHTVKKQPQEGLQKFISIPFLSWWLWLFFLSGVFSTPIILCHFFQQLHQNLHAQSKTNTVISIQKNTQKCMYHSTANSVQMSRKRLSKNLYLYNMPKDREEIPAHKTMHTYHQRILIRYIEVIFIGPEVNFYARILLFIFMSYSLS